MPIAEPTAADLTILRALLGRGAGEFVSGNKLATELGISRVAVWQHMRKLRAQGFRFEAIRSRGYRIAGRPARLHPGLIRASLPADNRLNLICLDRVDSTNDEAARRLAAGEPTPLVVASRAQTSGRGRLGRPWHSADNGNLYLSFAFRPHLAPERMSTFTLWMGVNICELVANFCRATPGLKWPNDLIFDGRKAGGMLTEARIDSDEIRDLVFGLGLNINSPAGAWPDGLATRAISLAEHLQAPLDLNRFTAALIGRVLRAYQAFADNSYRDTFADLWQRYDFLRGKHVTLLEHDRRHAGTVLGIDDEGALLLRDEGGRTQRFRAGETTLSAR
jgi:BirA family biotin operon repressor/biotin-[acetyl-CoA-carboxylase] ligase